MERCGGDQEKQYSSEKKATKNLKFKGYKKSTQEENNNATKR